ncbi:MAG: YbaN family protein [Pseudomonadales bacterium]|nr:YbaN family protein [Pseudomonadales bacterium]
MEEPQSRTESPLLLTYMTLIKALFILLGFISFALGFIGIFLPLLPTTPFILLAAFFFSKSSERFYGWLINIPTFGPMIMQWNEYGCVSQKGKIASAVAMTAVIVYFWIFREMAIPIKLAVTCIMLTVMAYVLSRPKPPQQLTAKKGAETL